MPDTTTLGYMLPEQEPVGDRPLEDIFQSAIKGITGIAGQWVRPQAPEVISNRPEVTQDWISFRITPRDFDFDPHLNHQPAALETGASEMTRDEVLEVILAFYGPSAHQYLGRWISGLHIDQNRWTLMDSGIKFQSHGHPVTLPALVKENWQRRIDLTSTFVRRSKVVYPIRTITGGSIGLHNERYITPIIVQQP